MKADHYLGMLLGISLLAGATSLRAQKKPETGSKPANTATTATKSGADKSEYRSIKEMIDIIPKQTVMQFKVQNKMDEALNTANQLLIEKVQGKAASMKVKAEGWQPWQYEGNPDRFSITVPYQTTNISGTSMGVSTWITVSSDQRPALEKMPKGQDVAVAGRLQRVYFSKNLDSGLLDLHVEISGAHLVRK